ncbi:hypothetical protein L596_024248 [Steinernema carpocapsae]|uniref:Acid phosphatase n=1 Tax=Steinernema carpocapsae TaxID=34508 RepID=A0A4U5MG71_STECR|nr:hypothetical protein L596_024248 [Steinernema carpocapsae]
MRLFLILFGALVGISVTQGFGNDAIYAARTQHKADISTLQFVQLVWRHGDRSPASLFPTDKGNNESTWTWGLGELTLKGMAQHYRLGKWLRKRYDGYLSKDYFPFEIFVRSSDYNRTLVSAQANLAGLFEPSKEEQWTPSLKWRPIPVHTIPQFEDKELYDAIKCPTGAEENERVYNSEAVVKIEKENEAFLRFIGEQSGMELPLRLQNLWNIFDPIYVESCHNDTHKVPSWVNATVFEQLTELYHLSTTFMYKSDLQKRLRAGPLLKSILTRMHEKVHGLVDHREKIYAYSAHDTSVSAILSAFGIIPSVFPHYATCAMVELHKIDGKNIVKLYYKNGTDLPEVFEYPIVGCEAPCSLEDAMLARKHVMPHNWKEECGLYKWYEAEIKTYLATIAILAFTTILFGTILLIDFVYKFGKRRIQNHGTPLPTSGGDDRRALLVESEEDDAAAE